MTHHARVKEHLYAAAGHFGEHVTGATEAVAAHLEANPVVSPPTLEEATPTESGEAATIS